MNVEQLELMAQIECANKETGHVECQLVMQCAPTLSLLKISNLMIASKEEYHLLCECLKNLQLHHQCLVWDDTNVILLVYREDALISYLQENPNRRFLAECGYPMSENSIHQINTHQNNTYHNIFQNNIRYEEKRMLASDLCILCKRYQAYWMSGAEFPHEIGIFLGYPIEDVKGFIHHHGSNDLFTGYWKVYARMPAKQDLFHRFEEIRKVMLHFLTFGLRMEKIIALIHGIED